MSSDKNGHSPRSRARRHFLGLTAATAAKVAALGCLLQRCLPARHRRWARNGGMADMAVAAEEAPAPIVS